MIHKVVTAAVAKVGWDKLDVYAIKKEMNSLRNFEPLDGLSRYTYTDKRPTTPWMTVLRVEGGKFVNVKPGGGFVEVPDLTPAAYR